MKNSKSGIVLCMIMTVLSALLAFGVRFLFHACVKMDGECQPCVDAQNAVFAVAIAMLVTSVLMFIMKKPAERCGLSAAVAVMGIMAAVIPNNLISLCMMPDMRCRSTMYPAVLAISIITAVVAVISVIINRRKEA